MRTSTWLEFFDGLFECQNLRCKRGKRDNEEEGDLNWAPHPSPRVSWYNRGSGIVEGDITEVRVYERGPVFKIKVFNALQTAI